MRWPDSYCFPERIESDRHPEYDLSDQDDAFKVALAKRGLIAPDTGETQKLETKTCDFCQTVNGFEHIVCSSCQRPFDRFGVFKKDEAQLSQLKVDIAALHDQLSQRKDLDVCLNDLFANPEIQTVVRKHLKHTTVRIDAQPDRADSEVIRSA